MIVIFRCKHCETLNEIPSDFRYRLCKKCSSLITYEIGESILCIDQYENCLEFTQIDNLTMESAEKFFSLADKNTEQISQLIKKHDNITSNLLDIPAASLPDTILVLLKHNNSETFDELVRNCRNFAIDLNKMEQVIKKMKNEGIVYYPKGWLIRLI